MFHRKRFYATVVLGALMSAFAAFAADGFDRYDALKRDMIRSAQPAALHDAAAMQALPRAALVTAIEVDSAAAEPAIVVRTTAEVPFDIVYIADGSEIILRTYGAILSPECKRMVIDGANVIDGVSVSMSAVEPQFVTAVRITLREPVAYTAASMKGGINVVLIPSPSQAALDRMVAEDASRAVTVARAHIAETRSRAELRVAKTREAVRATFGVAAQRLQDAKLRFLQTDLAQAASSERDTRQDAFRMDLLLQETRLQDAGVALQRIESVLNAAPATALATLDAAATAQQVDAIVAGFDREFDGAIRALHELYTSIDAHVARVDSLVAQLPQSPAANPLDALDRSMASLRNDTRPVASPPQTPLDELSAALERVRAQSPSYALAPPAQFAALMNDDEQMPSAPPAARSANRGAADSAAQGFQRVEEIRASDAVLRAAEATGAIVLAQAGQDPEEPVEAEVITDAEMRSLPEPSSRVTLSDAAAAQPPAHLYNPNVPASQDPLRQPVNIDFQEMDLSTVVGLLARKAQINVIADEKVEGSVTANLVGIPLGRAIEVVLRMNNLGIVEEEGVYRITSYEEAIASRRDTRMIPLENAQAEAVAKNITDLLANSPDQMLLSVSASPSTNHLILTGPIELIRDYEVMAKTLDVAPQVVPTVTKAVKLNYSSPEELLPIVSSLVGDTGRVSGDVRGRHLVVTDIPVKVEEITKLIQELDVAVRQVNISAMIVDAVLSDDAQTGIDWTLNAIRRTDRDGNVVSNLASLSTEQDFTTGPVTPGIVPGINLGSQIMFGILSGDFDIRAAIAAEVASNNGELLANPTIVTLENKPARISISEEVPYQELTQSLTGPPIATTEFKEIGTTLEVTTRVTHDDHVIVDIGAKQSDTKGESVTGVPIEDKREADTSLRVRNGQTIFIGGLRRFDDELSVRKTPILGDIPVLNFLFRNQSVVKENVELLIFLTCNIMPEMVPELTPAQKDKFDKLGGVDPEDINATRDMVRNYLHPDDQRDPIYKWRRTK